MKGKIISTILIGAMFLTAISGCSKANTTISISDTLSIAERYLSEMKYEQAIIEFDKILSVEPKNADAYIGKAEANIGLRDYSEAADILNICIKTAENIDYITLIGIAEKILDADSMVIDAYMVIADAFITLGEVEKAINTLKKGYEQTGNVMFKQKLSDYFDEKEPNDLSVFSESTYDNMTTETVQIGEEEYQTDETKIILSGCGLNDDDIKDLSKFIHLSSLVINNNNLSDLSPISGLKELKYLDISHNNISDISFVSELTDLEWLSMRCNEIEDISALRKLNKLNYVCLEMNKIKDISVLSSLTSLKETDNLNFEQNSITDISVLSEFKNLRWICLYGNNISDISSIAMLNKLEGISAGENNISDISPLMSLSELTDIDFCDNEISDISPLVKLKKINRLYLSNNHISDLDVIEQILNNNSNLDTCDVYLYNNDFSFKDSCFLSSRMIGIDIPEH